MVVIVVVVVLEEEWLFYCVCELLFLYIRYIVLPIRNLRRLGFIGNSAFESNKIKTVTFPAGYVCTTTTTTIVEYRILANLFLLLSGSRTCGRGRFETMS